MTYKLTFQHSRLVLNPDSNIVIIMTILYVCNNLSMAQILLDISAVYESCFGNMGSNFILVTTGGSLPDSLG